MGLRDLERAIERGVDGVLGRVFRSDVSELEINKRVERELDAGTRRGDRGARVMPNDIEVRIHPNDANALSSNVEDVESKLLSMARAHAHDNSCVFEGPLTVAVSVAEDAQPGTIQVFATAEHSISGIAPGTLVYPDGYRYDLPAAGAEGIILGRGEDSHIVIDDQMASRSHAHIRPSPQGWVLEDLGSTNGTRVNGFRTTAQLLSDGDMVKIGATEFRFYAS